ncbi:unnamed protein product [Protopolystoma xenopodis]|uniref:Uncharacterized protein n=1 Tax=Protopolystoma xenopodis TaxID=117903 RepID=A0A3S5CCD5_9PLAT|nr:unnamed protein product [Protopolystoma xenopodis]
MSDNGSFPGVTLTDGVSGLHFTSDEHTAWPDFPIAGMLFTAISPDPTRPDPTRPDPTRLDPIRPEARARRKADPGKERAGKSQLARAHSGRSNSATSSSTPPFLIKSPQLPGKFDTPSPSPGAGWIACLPAFLVHFSCPSQHQTSSSLRSYCQYVHTTNSKQIPLSLALFLLLPSPVDMASKVDFLTSHRNRGIATARHGCKVQHYFVS